MTGQQLFRSACSVFRFFYVLKIYLFSLWITMNSYVLVKIGH